MKNKNYLPIIVVLRGLAALAVCMFHFSKGFVAEDSLTRELFRYGWMGVEVFFVISGFVIPFSLLGTSFSFKNYGGFMKKRFIRIEPAYLVSVILVLALNYLSTLVPGYAGAPFQASMSLVLEHLGYLVRFFDNAWLNPVYWTLEIEFHYYLLVGLLIALWNLKNKNLTILSVLVLVLSAFLKQDILPFFKYADIFVLGIITAFYRREMISLQKYVLALVAISTIIFYNHGITISALTILTASFIAFLSDWGNYRFLIFLGHISYSLYLIHVPIGGRVINFAKRYNLNELQQVGIIGLALVISILTAWAFYVFIERPTHKWAKTISLK